MIAPSLEARFCYDVNDDGARSPAPRSPPLIQERVVVPRSFAMQNKLISCKSSHNYKHLPVRSPGLPSMFGKEVDVYSYGISCYHNLVGLNKVGVHVSGMAWARNAPMFLSSQAKVMGVAMASLASRCVAMFLGSSSFFDMVLIMLSYIRLCGDVHLCHCLSPCLAQCVSWCLFGCKVGWSSPVAL